MWLQLFLGLMSMALTPSPSVPVVAEPAPIVRVEPKTQPQPTRHEIMAQYDRAIAQSLRNAGFQ